MTLVSQRESKAPPEDTWDTAGSRVGGWVGGKGGLGFLNIHEEPWSDWLIGG